MLILGLYPRLSVLDTPGHAFVIGAGSCGDPECAELSTRLGTTWCLTMCPLSKTTGFESLAQRPHQFVIKAFFGLIFRRFGHSFVQQMPPGPSLCPRHSAGFRQRTRKMDSTARTHRAWARPSLSKWQLRSLSPSGGHGSKGSDPPPPPMPWEKLLRSRPVGASPVSPPLPETVPLRCLSLGPMLPAPSSASCQPLLGESTAAQQIGSTAISPLEPPR